MPYAICLLYPPLSLTDYIQIYHLCLLGMTVSSAWHEADPHYAELVSVGIGSQPYSPPPSLPPFQMPSRYIKHLIFQSLVLPISIPFSSIPGAYIYDLPTSTSGFPWWLSSKEPACQCRRCGLDPWIRKIPWRRKWQPTPLFLPGKSHGQRSLADYSPWDRKRVRHDLVTKQQRATSASKMLTLENHPSDLNVYPFPSPILHKLHPNHQPLKSCRTPILTLSQASLTSQSEDRHI